MIKCRLFLFVLILGLLAGCKKNDSGRDAQMTLGTLNLGNFTPVSQSSYKRPEGYILKLSNDTMSFTMLLPELKIGDYSITNEPLPGNDAIFNIDFKTSSYSASEGVVSVTDTSNNSLTGIYTVDHASTGTGDPLKISTGSFSKVKIETLPDNLVEDYEHNQYKTVDIGSQTWMAENLRSRIYANGDSIRDVYEYSNNDSLTKIYGLYYTWNSATHNSPVEMTQGACPTGWHLPSDAEWQQLLVSLGGEAVAGGKLKSIISWNTVNVNADNSSGFSALGAGVHQPVAEYPDLSERMGYMTLFWSSTFDATVNNISTAWSVSVNNAARSVLRSPFYRTDMGISVRCIKN